MVFKLNEEPYKSWMACGFLVAADSYLHALKQKLGRGEMGDG